VSSKSTSEIMFMTRTEISPHIFDYRDMDFVVFEN